MKDLDNIPNSLLKVLQPFLKVDTELYTMSPDSSVYLNFIGKKYVSDCYFKVVEYNNDRGSFSLEIVQKPQNEHLNNEYSSRITLDLLTKYHSRWVTLIEERNNLLSIFKQNDRMKAVEDEFFSYSSFYAEEFDNEYFSITELNQLSNESQYLIDVIKTNDAISNKTEIINELLLLEQNCSEESKRKIAQRISKIQALLIKNGPKILTILKDVSVNVIGNVVSKMITG